jgi:DNA polymerase-3 subunit gamma/tau
MSQALYRKWRPQKFSELFGQDHIRTTLQNALSSHRITHAYLFAGPRGTGKTSTARLLAKSVNCQNFKDSEPCNKCSSCQEIQKGQNLDLIEIDAASNRGIEEIKDLREKIKFTPVKSKYKVYVIDEVHQLTLPAFNALLKTLEEPPAHVIFVLATTEVHKIPLTILSRCQRFDFRRLSISDLINRISYIVKKENLKIDEEAAKLIAQSASGSARDAESLLDLIISRGLSSVKKKDVEEILGITETERIKELYEFLIKKDTASVLSILNQVSDEGKDLFQFSSNLIEFLREKLLANPSGTLVSWIKLLCQAQKEMKNTALVQLPLELAVIEMITKDTKEEGSNPGIDSKHLSLDWNKLIAEMKPENHSLCFILENCQPIEIKEDQVILGVDFKFHKDKLEEPKNRQKIETALKKITGRDFKIICQVVKGIQKIKVLNHENNDLVDDAKEIFEIKE